MPSPFPGMDPYLESPQFWRDVHHSLIYTIRAALRPVLPPQFVARIEERLAITGGDGDMRPDVAVVRTGAERPAGATAVQERTAPDEPIVFYDELEEIREGYIEIVALDNPERVITAIEVLSPTNKTRGSGRVKYICKQRRMLLSETHLLEIDLLRAGAHTVGAPEARLRAEAGRWD